jgi:hypothetical protein
MKNLILIFFVSVCFSCKQKQETQPEIKQLSIAKKIANAHGFENWKNVSQIDFTFNGQRNWSWKPKTNNVTLITETDTLTYNRKNVDSLSTKVNGGFVNDKFWLLIPFQLVWDKNATISESTKAEAPISKTELNKITLTYSNEGGYTPGDAYDIYYGDNFLIKEWVFRRGNSDKPSLTNTFESYQDFNGIKIATEHKTSDGGWNLVFTNVKVITD